MTTKPKSDKRIEAIAAWLFYTYRELYEDRKWEEITDYFERQVWVNPASHLVESDPLTAAYTQLEKRCAELEDGLRELIFLKEHKEAHGKDELYLDAQPKVWEKAKQALKGGDDAKG